MKKKLSVSENQERQLLVLAHEGTPESVKKIEGIMLNVDDEKTLAFARLAYEEALFNAYAPQTDEEESDFMLGCLVSTNEERIFNLQEEAEKLERLFVKNGTERKIHEKVLASASSENRDAWGYFWFPDAGILDQNRHKEITSEITYWKAWLVQARTFFATNKYANAPAEIYSFIQCDDGDTEFDDDFEDDTDTA